MSIRPEGRYQVSEKDDEKPATTSENAQCSDQLQDQPPQASKATPIAKIQLVSITKSEK